mmetsp:Transcript_51233/g.111408  ORF Transcript_51233/g.111408 Transcript_51233/m.111408 type:complete len:103 (+) Transcript_51233:489-797(+)
MWITLLPQAMLSRLTLSSDIDPPALFPQHAHVFKANEESDPPSRHLPVLASGVMSDVVEVSISEAPTDAVMLTPTAEGVVFTPTTAQFTPSKTTATCIEVAL